MRRVNLLPEAYKRIENKRFVRKVVLVLGGVTALTIAILHLVLHNEAQGLVAALESPAAVRESPEISRLLKETETLKQEARNFIEQNADIVEIALRRGSLADVMIEIGNAAVDKVWLTDLTIDMKEGTCVIEGKSLNSRLVSEYMLLAKQSAYFNAVDLVAMGKDTDEIDFKLTLLLNRIIPPKQLVKP